MAYICEHCQGDHPSNRCPTFPQFCTGCNEEHPWGTECYKWQEVVESDTTEIDAQIAEEERIKAEEREALRIKENEADVSSRAKKREKTYSWRQKNPEAYRAYMRDYMRKKRRDLRRRIGED